MLLKTSVTESPNPIVRSDRSQPSFANVPARSSKTPLRVAFYSHDTMGMGHIRRNLLIASSLVRSDANIEALLVAGTREASFFAAQAGLDCVTLPALAKDGQGCYSARHLGWNFEQTVRMRSRIIAATLDEFRPDLFVVDKIPLGIGNELLSSLRLLKSHPTQCVLGLRDILDEPHVVAREWHRDGNDQAIVSYFDELWIYGDRAVYDSIGEYNFCDSVAERALYTGYLNQSQRTRVGGQPSSSGSDANLPSTPFALCVVGGGQDGFELAQAFVNSSLPTGLRGIVITGPFMPKPEVKLLRDIAALRGDIEIIDRMVETDDYMRQAERVVAMGGYNTVTSVLSFGKPALIVPRTRPRREQWIRADRLARRGWLTAIDPDHLDSQRMSEWLMNPSPLRPESGRVDLLGLSRIGSRVSQLCSKKNSVEV